MAAKSQGVHPGGKLREKPPVSQRKMRGKAEELHDDERAEGADAARGEAGGEVRHTPAECRRYSEKDVQRRLDCRGVVPRAKARFFADDFSPS
jgi:hypothetical protein